MKSCTLSAPGRDKSYRVLTIRRHHRLVGNAVGVLPTRRLSHQERSERASIRLRGVPARPDGIPAVAKAFLVDVAFLRNDSGDPPGWRIASPKPVGGP